MKHLMLYCADLSGDDLPDKDKRKGQRLGAWLAREGKPVRAIFCPDHGQYPELAIKLAKAMNGAKQLVTPIPPSKIPKAVMNANGHGADRLLLVGTIHGIREVVETMQIHSEGKVARGTILGVSLSGAKKENVIQARLVEQFHVKTLPKKFPFPAPDGKERRDRPAYYYRQSAVIPYACEGEALRVLVIGSSKKKHLVVPKGIHEPGLSAQASAAKESLEEAGVRGEVQNILLGEYTYEKWNATCRVEVYPQRVTDLLPEEAWEERHRGRQWMTPSEASSAVREEKLGPMIMKLQQLNDEGKL